MDKRLLAITLALFASVTLCFGAGSPYVVNYKGVATNLTVIKFSDTLTNHFHVLGLSSADVPVPLPNGQYTQVRLADALGTTIRIYTIGVANRWLAVDTNASVFLQDHYNIVNNTNGTPDTWGAVYLASSPDGTNNWSNGGPDFATQPTSGYGWLLPALVGDGSGLTNLNLSAYPPTGYTNTLDKAINASGTLLPMRLSYPTNIVQANGRSIGFVAGTNVLTSTNNAFAGVWPGTQVQFTNSVQFMITSVSNANNAVGFQIGSGIEKEPTQVAMPYSTNWNFNTAFRLRSDNVGNFISFEDQNGGFWGSQNANGGMTLFNSTPTTLPSCFWMGYVPEGAAAYPTTKAGNVFTMGSSGPTWGNPGIFSWHPLAQPNSFRIETNSTVAAKFGITTPQTMVATNGVASQASIAAVVINPTGVTNTFTVGGVGISARAFLNTTNTAYVYVTSTAHPLTPHSGIYTSSVMNACIQVTLQPGEAVTNLSGLSGKMVPW